MHLLQQSHNYVFHNKERCISIYHMQHLCGLMAENLIYKTNEGVNNRHAKSGKNGFTGMA